MNAFLSNAMKSAASVARNARSTAILGALALALPAAKAGPWTSVGSAGTLDDETYVFGGSTPGVRAVMSGARVAVASAFPQQTIRVRYNVVDVFGRNGFAYPALGANFVDNGANAQVVLYLFEQNKTSTLPRLLLTLNSNSYAPSASPQAQSVGAACRFSLDFNRNSYWVEAVLTRSASDGAPALNEIRVEDEFLC